MRGRLRRIEDRRVEGGTERGERTLSSTGGYPTVEELRSAVHDKQARIVELKRKLRYMYKKTSDKLEWLLKLSKKASAEVTVSSAGGCCSALVDNVSLLYSVRSFP